MSQPGQQIIQARKNKGLSQEQLAENSKINLRTLQRIEKGETIPRGDTLRRISESLGLPLENLVSYISAEDYGYIKAMHFSALVFIILPLGNILLPLILWLVKKDKVKDLTYFAKKLINFQITWSLITYLPFLIPIPWLWGSNIHSSPFVFSLSHFITWNYPVILYSLNIIYLIIAGIVIKDRQRNFFPVSIPFLR